MKKSIKILFFVGLATFMTSSKTSFARDLPTEGEGGGTARYETTVCMKSDPNGGLQFGVACNTPKTDGPCDRIQNCTYS